MKKRTMKTIIKKTIAMILMLAMSLMCVGCGKDDEEEDAADYSSPREAIEAYQSGEDIIGKTVEVTATMDSAAGLIYVYADTKVDANIYVTLISEEAASGEILTMGAENVDYEGSGILDVKMDDTVTVKIDSIDDHLKYSIYIFGTLE